MPKSSAATVDELLAELPGDRRAAVGSLRSVIRKNLPEGYVESVSGGLLSDEIPLETYPNAYKGKPLGHVALAAQKNGCSGTFIERHEASRAK